MNFGLHTCFILCFNHTLLAEDQADTTMISCNGVGPTHSLSTGPLGGASLLIGRSFFHFGCLSLGFGDFVSFMSLDWGFGL